MRMQNVLFVMLKIIPEITLFLLIYSLLQYVDAFIAFSALAIQYIGEKSGLWCFLFSVSFSIFLVSKLVTAVLQCPRRHH